MESTFSVKTAASGISVAAALAFGIQASAEAAITVFDSQSAFAAAVGAVTEHGFDGIATGNAYLYFTSPVVVDGVEFASLSGTGAFVIEDGAGYGNYGHDFFSAQLGNPNGATVTFGVERAIGFAYGSYTQANGPLVVFLDSEENYAAATPANAGTELNFIGFVSDGAPIRSVTFLEGNMVFALDIARFYTAAPVPLPAGAWLLGAGLAAIAGRARRDPHA